MRFEYKIFESTARSTMRFEYKIFESTARSTMRFEYKIIFYDLFYTKVKLPFRFLGVELHTQSFNHGIININAEILN